MSEKPLTVLCIPLSGLGHINATLGLALVLQKRGHKIVFATEKAWTGEFIQHGFDEEIYEEREPIENEKAGEFWGQFMRSLSAYFRKPTIEQIELSRHTYPTFIKAIKFSNPRIKAIIEIRKPDIIIQDHYLCYPAIGASGIPTVFLYSANPLRAWDDEKLPPGSSGYPLDNDETDKWKAFRERWYNIVRDLWTDFNEYVIREGAPSLKFPSFQYRSSSVNIYMTPKSLAAKYLERSHIPSYWHRLEHSLRETNETRFEIPETLQNLPGKLIYLSMGSMGSSDVELMKLLVSILAKVPHRFIVSLGHAHKQYEIAENMWGQPVLPQTAILPLVDLVITHGGNNSFVESLYYGKPMILVPLFADQNDNAQLAEEARVGLKYKPFEEPPENLVKKIDQLLNDEEVYRNTAKVSQEMQSSQSLEKIAQLVEETARNPTHPLLVEQHDNDNKCKA